jgi:hypothetical protein
LQTAPETIDLLKRRGVPFHIEETKAAVALYNHSTHPAHGLSLSR